MPWAQGGLQSNTQDLSRHRLEGLSDPSVGEGPRHLEHLPPTKTTSHDSKAINIGKLMALGF